ncbi:MAG: ATP synthase F1 subunit epsilon [Cyanobacteria bacterium P01_H01_bin.15]
MALTVRVITPDSTVWDQEAEEAILPSTTGQLGILSGHAPLLSALDIGVVRVRTGQTWEAIAVMGGFAEMDNNELKVLVNAAQRGSDIDAEAAESEFVAAEERRTAAQASGNAQELIQAEREFKRSRARKQAAAGVA